ncbi:MAG: D-alanine--D-alanine ligase [Synoicihabitans sp.]
MSTRRLSSKRVLALMHEDLVPPDSIAGLSEEDIHPWKMEYDVKTTLERMGHEVHAVGIYGDLDVLREALERIQPDVVFNMMEEFDGQPLMDQHLVSYLELNHQAYTGCNPRGLTLAHDKALSKRILAHHGIPVPQFGVFPVGRKVRRSKALAFPLLVKSLVDEGSVGISRASVVRNDTALNKRVELIHRQTGRAAIAEEYIAGREIYMSLVGNERVKTFTPWELKMKHLPAGAPNIATSKLKWSYAHQEEVGLYTEAAALSASESRRLVQLSKRIYAALSLTGYARLDFRMSAAGEFYLLEANPNPCLAYGEDFAEAVETAGTDYETLLDLILRGGLARRSNV